MEKTMPGDKIIIKESDIEVIDHPEAGKVYSFICPICKQKVILGGWWKPSCKCKSWSINFEIVGE